MIQLLHQLENPDNRSPDLEFYRHGADYDSNDPVCSPNTVWWEASVAIAAFGFQFLPSELHPALREDALKLRVPGSRAFVVSPAHLAQKKKWTEDFMRGEREREKRIRDWVEGCGGWENALQQSPIIALYYPEQVKQLDLIDGWHRMKLAQQASRDTVTALLGLVA